MTLIRTGLPSLKAKDRTRHRPVVGGRLDDFAGRDLVRNGGDSYRVVRGGRRGLSARAEAAGSQEPARQGESGLAGDFEELPPVEVEPHETRSLALLAPGAFVLLLLPESPFKPISSSGDV